MIDDKQEEKNLFEKDPNHEDADLAFLRAVLQFCVPKQKILMLHPARFKEMLSAINLIVLLTDGQMKEFREKAEYSLSFDPLFGEDALFDITIPDMGLFLNNENLLRLLRVLPKDIELSFTPLLEERLSICITFKRIRVLLDHQTNNL